MRWECFRLADVFDIKPTADGIDKVRLAPGEGKYPYVTRSDMNNGVNMLVARQEGFRLNEGNCISVGSDTQTVFYQPTDFYTGNNVNILRHSRINAYTGKFLLPLLERTLSVFCWGHAATLTRIKRSKIFLPVDDSGNPNWAFMEGYMRERERAMIERYISHVMGRISGGGMLSLEGVRWAGFVIGDLFTLIPGKGRGANHLEPGNDGISYLGATNRNNAVLDFVKPEEGLVQKGNCIAFIRNGEGSMGYSVYKAEDFIATSDITLGYAPFLNRYTGTFITTVADQVRGRYSYNYKRSDTRLRKEVIQLPVDSSGNPDWAFMEAYMRQEEQRLIQDYANHQSDKLRIPPPREIRSLECVEWRTFYIRDIFSTIQRGKRLKNDDHIAGDVPYVSSSAMNNGVDDFVDNTDGVRRFSDCITIANSGSVGSAFYHSYEFIASDHVTALKAPGMSRHVYMFIAAAAGRLREKYSFNREINESRINRERIMLPVDSSGNPDYSFMAGYMRSLETRLLTRWLDAERGRE